MTPPGPRLAATPSGEARWLLPAEAYWSPEWFEAERRDPSHCHPAYMMDQSHNVTDPVESLLNSSRAIQAAYARALIVDREALRRHQNDNDVMMAHNALRMAFEMDMRPAQAEARLRKLGALDPIACFRASSYRAHKAETRAFRPSPGGGIV